MSRKGIKIKILLGLFSISLGYGCGDSERKSKSFIQKKFQSYSQIYKLLNDSVQRYVDSALADYGAEYMYGWVVDSMICINSANDQLFALTIEIPQAGKGYFSDDAMQLLGKKINGSWYFFKPHSTLTIPRSMYGFSETIPPTQYHLSQVARKEMMESALIKKGGEYVVDDEWIDKKFYDIGWGVYSTRAEYDSIHWKNILRKWKEKIDTNEYKPLKKFRKDQPTS